MNKTLTATRLSKREKRKQQTLDWDSFGRTGYMQVMHIELWYVDGSKGEINITSPHIIWSEDVETQYYYMREYLKSQHDRLGIVRYRGHCYHNINGILKKVFSYAAFDLITNSNVEGYE
ncbi:hypothetical protein [Spirosoma gilvum]